MLYYLHIPRSGGTSTFFMLNNKLKIKENNLNGNWCDLSNNLIKFWEWDIEMQMQSFSDIDIIFNESQLGTYFFPEKVKYFTIIRNPIDIVLSIIQYNYCVGMKDNFINKNDIRDEFNKFLYKNLPGFVNYVLRFFYKTNCCDKKLLFNIACERIRYFDVILFENINELPNYLSKYTNHIFDKLPYKHNRPVYGTKVMTFDDLTDENKILIKQILKEDLEFYDYVKNYLELNK